MVSIWPDCKLNCYKNLSSTPLNIYVEEGLAVSYEKTKRQVKYWQYAAWSLPFLALALLAVTHFVGLSSIYSILIAVIVCSFFFASVFWWWWTLDKILIILKAFEETGKSLGWIQKDIADTKHEIRQSLSDRERREQKESES